MLNDDKNIFKLFKEPVFSVIYSGFINNVNDWKKSRHSHSFSEILFVKKGRGKVIINDVKHEVKYGDVIIYNPDDVHQELSYENEEFKIFFVALKELGSTVLSKIVPVGKPQIVASGINAIKTENFFSEIIESMENKKNQSTDLPIYLAGMLVNFIQKLFEKVRLGYDSEQMCEEFKNIIDRDFCAIKNINDILKQMYVSKYYFYDKFKTMYGNTPIYYLRMKKIMYSKELLTNTELKIVEIANLIGFDNELYFSRLFTKEVGMSASEYRKSKNNSLKLNS